MASSITLIGWLLDQLKDTYQGPIGHVVYDWDLSHAHEREGFRIGPYSGPNVVLIVRLPKPNDSIVTPKWIRPNEHSRTGIRSRS